MANRQVKKNTNFLLKNPKKYLSMPAALREQMLPLSMTRDEKWP